MSTIHELSSLVALPELDLFIVPPTQLMVEHDIQTEHRPISTLSSGSPIQFEIHSGYDEYINIGKSELYLCVRISLSKTNIAVDPTIKAADWKTIAPINYLMNSMFKQVKFSIGQSSVTSASLNYAHLAYMDALINKSPEAKRTHMQTSFWFRDISGSMESINDERSKLIRPTGSSMEQGCDFEMHGNLHLDLGTQVKSLLGGVSLNLSLYPADPKFYLMFDKLLIPKVEILEARFYVHRSKICQQVILAHNKALENGNARYFVTRKEVKSFIIQQNTIDCYINNVENGVLPRRVFVAFVSNEAFNGNGDLNPFNFKNYSLRHIACYIDGQQYPQRAYSPDFNNKKFAREYYGLYESANQLNGNANLDITKSEFNEGFTIFGFNFSPDLSDGCNKSGYVAQIKRGNLRIELKFNHPLIETVSALVFCEYDNLIEISSSRTAFKDFN